MKTFCPYEKAVLPGVVALALAASMSISLSGCGSSSAADPTTTTTTVTVATTTTTTGVTSEQNVPIPDPIPAVSDYDANIRLHADGPENTMAVVGGGASGKLWVYDARYRQLATIIWPSQGDGANNARMAGSHNYNYPDLHDPHAIVPNKDYSKLYTLNWFDYADTSYVIEFDTKTLKETARVSTGGKGAHHLSITPDGKFLYAAHEYSSTVGVIDLATMKRVADVDVGFRSTYPNNGVYWWTNDANGAPQADFIPSPYVFVTTGGTVPVSNTVAAPAGSPACNCVSVIDYKNGHKLVKQIPIGTGIHAVNVTPDGKEAWVTQTGGESGVTGVPGSGDLTVIDTTSLKIIKRIKIGVTATHLAFSKDNHYAYVGSGNMITKVDRFNNRVVWRTAGISGFAHLSLSPDQNELWDLNHGFSATRYPYLLGAMPVTGVQVFDANSGAFVYEMVHENVAHEMLFVPKAAFGSLVVTTNPNVAVGKAVFDTNCVGCHGANGAGAGIGVPLNTGTWFNLSGAVADVVNNGISGNMPAWRGKLSATDISAVSTYIASLGNPADRK